MSEDNNATNNNETNETSTKETEVSTSTDNLAEIKAELERNRELIKTLRKYEKSYKEENEKALTEQGKFKELYEAEKARVQELDNSLKSLKTDSVISELVKNSGAKNLNTVKKLLDKSAIEFNEDGSVNDKSIAKQIASIQKEAPELFGLGKDETPPPTKASGDEATASFEIEMKKAKTQVEIMAVLKKYGKV